MRVTEPLVNEGRLGKNRLHDVNLINLASTRRNGGSEKPTLDRPSKSVCSRNTTPTLLPYIGRGRFEVGCPRGEKLVSGEASCCVSDGLERELLIFIVRERFSLFSLASLVLSRLFSRRTRERVSLVSLISLSLFSLSLISFSEKFSQVLSRSNRRRDTERVLEIPVNFHSRYPVNLHEKGTIA